MRALLGLLGLVFVVIVIVDLLWTTVAAGSGAGPFTIRLGNVLRQLAPRGSTTRHHRFLQVLGVGITIALVGAWIALLLLGWFLVFNSAPDAVVDATTGEPADQWARVYYTGFTIFTLGVGDYVAGGPLWQVATVAATGTGLALITLAITYLVSVTASVTQRRRLAQQISALGETPTEIMRVAWNGDQLEGLDITLQLLMSDIAEVTQRHLAFPMLHYFHSFERNAAIAPGLAVVDELLMVLEHGVRPDKRLPALTTHQVRHGIAQLLSLTIGTTKSSSGRVSGTPPPLPALEDLRRFGIPLVDDEVWRNSVESLASRRQRLSDFLAVDGWDWPSVWESPGGSSGGA